MPQPILRPAESSEIELAFDIKRDAMGPHVAAKWGWNEVFQREHHFRRWREKPWHFIVVEGQVAGTVSLDWQSTHLQFGEFYVASPFRGQGIGTVVLAGALIEADARALETKLEYLKWNPVASLYARHGFKVVEQSETHFLAVRPPGAA